MPGPGLGSWGDKREPDRVLGEAESPITVGCGEPRALLGVPGSYGNTGEALDPDQWGERRLPGKGVA